MDTAAQVLSSSVGPRPPVTMTKSSPIQALTKMFDDIVFDVPDGDHPVEEKTSIPKLHRDVVGVRVRYIAEQNFIADRQQGSGNMRRLIFEHNFNPVPSAKHPPQGRTRELLSTFYICFQSKHRLKKTKIIRRSELSDRRRREGGYRSLRQSACIPRIPESASGFRSGAARTLPCMGRKPSKQSFPRAGARSF